MAEVDDMYADVEPDPTPQEDGTAINVARNGAIHTVKIGQDTIQVIDPAYVFQLETRLASAMDTIRRMDEQMRVLQGNQRRHASEIMDTKRQLGTKVGYE